jgi:hypothetical protein
MKISISLRSSSFTYSFVKVLVVFVFFIWALISLYALYTVFQVGAENVIKDFFSTLGSLMAGSGTLALVFFAYKAYLEWERQEAIKIEDKVLSEFRMQSHIVKRRIFSILEFLRVNSKILADSRRSKNEVKELLPELRNLYDEYQSSVDFQVSNFNKLKQIYLMSSKAQTINDYEKFIYKVNMDVLKWLHHAGSGRAYNMLDNNCPSDLDNELQYSNTIFEYIKLLNKEYRNVFDLTSELEIITRKKLKITRISS